jgi:hypothetical protein
MKKFEEFDHEAKVYAMLENLEINSTCPECGKMSFDGKRLMNHPVTHNSARTHPADR